MNSDIESLMSQYLDGRMTPAEAAELSRLLIENPEAAARFAELTRTDENLRTALKAESRSAIFSARLRTQAENQPAKTTTSDRRRWLAAAAGIAVLGGTAWWFASDRTVPTVVMDWAKSRVKRHSGGSGNTDDSGPLASADVHASTAVDRAADLRRKLRNFAIPYLHMRSMPVSDALNTLSLQWTSLPHVKPEDAEKVKITLAESVRKRWPTTDKEPVVSVDIPNLSLHTALNLVAAQAGLKVDVSDEAVTLIPDASLLESTAHPVAVAAADISRTDKDTIKDEAVEVGVKSEDLKTWTFPLTKPVAETFLTSLNQRQQPIATDPANLADSYTVSGRLDTTANAAPASHYNFSYAWAKQPPASIAGVAGAVAATGTAEANVELSFTLADTATPEAKMPEVVTLHDVNEVLDRTEAHTVASIGEVVANSDQPSAVPTFEGQVMLDSTGQESLSLPRLSTTDPSAQTGTASTVMTYDVLLTGAAATTADGATPAAAPPQASYLAENPPVQPTTTLGVGSASAEAMAGVRVRVDGSTDNRLLFTRLTGSSSSTQPGQPVTVTTRFAQADPRLGRVIWMEKPSPATLDSWLTGLSGGGTVSHDTDNNVLSVTGTAAELRTAAAAVAALNESVQWGVSVDARYIELGDLPAPEIRTDSGAPTMASAEVDKLCKAAASTAGSACVRLPASPGPLEKTAYFGIENGDIQTAVQGISSSKETASSIKFQEKGTSPDLFLDATVTAAKQGERWTMTTTMKDGSSELNNKTSLMDGSWLVLEGTKGRFLLLRPRSANIGS